MIRLDFKKYSNIDDNEIDNYKDSMLNLEAYFEEHKNMMGWYDIEKLSSEVILDNIKKKSEYIKNNCDVFLVVGIGGSYMGALSVIEALNPYFYNNTKTPQIYFVGTSLSSEYLEGLKELIKDKDIIVNFISKSGTTFETTLIYTLIEDIMKSKYSKEELRSRTIFTTGNSDSDFVIPCDIGGRFSLFTPAGLLPISVSGMDIEKLLSGAKDSMQNLDRQKEYAIIRDIMNKRGKAIEAYVVYEPKLYYLTEWLKQLYAESLGKKEQGILPIGMVNTRDLHSLGQFLQEGKRNIFETVINIKNTKNSIFVADFNKTLNEINNIVSLSSTIAHYNSNVSNNIIEIDELNEYNLGYLLQFFMVSCAISGFIEGVNAFDQEGVESYKNTMKALLKQ